MSVHTLTLNNGRKIPQIGLGTLQIKGGEEAKNAITTAIDAGYRHIDSAYIHRNEKFVGEAVREKIAEGVIKREDIFITSKLWITDHNPDKIIPACKRSVKTLGLAYIDLYLIHCPFAINTTEDADIEDIKASDPSIFDNTTLEQKWGKMEECVRLGLVKSIGISNFNSKQVDTILKVAKIKPVTNQVECHPYLNQRQLIEFCKERDILITAYSPLGSPSCPDNPFVEKIPNLFEESIIKHLAANHKKTPAQIILRYVVQLGTVVIPKSANKQRMTDNLNIFDFSLSAEDMEEIDLLNNNLRTFTFYASSQHKFYPFHLEF